MVRAMHAAKKRPSHYKPPPAPLSERQKELTEQKKLIWDQQKVEAKKLYEQVPEMLEGILRSRSLEARLCGSEDAEALAHFFTSVKDRLMFGDSQLFLPTTVRRKFCQRDSHSRLVVVEEEERIMGVFATPVLKGNTDVARSHVFYVREGAEQTIGRKMVEVMCDMVRGFGVRQLKVLGAIRAGDEAMLSLWRAKNPRIEPLQNVVIRVGDGEREDGHEEEEEEESNDYDDRIEPYITEDGVMVF